MEGAAYTMMAIGAGAGDRQKTDAKNLALNQKLMIRCQMAVLSQQVKLFQTNNMLAVDIYILDFLCLLPAFPQYNRLGRKNRGWRPIAGLRMTGVLSDNGQCTMRMATPRIESTVPVARLRVSGVALLAKRAPSCAQSNVLSTQKTRLDRSGIPPITK